MALRLKTFAVLALLGCALVALAGLPPEGSPPRFGRFQRPGGSSALLRETIQTHELVRLLERAQELSASAAGLEAGRLVLGTDLAGTGPRAAAERLESQWRAFPQPPAASVLVAVGSPAVRDASIPVARIVRFAQFTQFVLPTRPETRYCVAVVRIPERVRAVSDPSDVTLGPCAFYAVFGPPGDAVADWLAAGASHFGLSLPWGEPDSLLIAARRERYRAFPAGFGASLYRSPLDNAQLREARCMLGRARDCRHLFLDTRQILDLQDLTGTHVAGTMGTSYYRIEGWYPFLLADLVRAFEHERFAAFWRSAAPVDEAFRSAFGVTVEDWMHDWLTELFGGLAPGVRTSPAAVVTSLGALIALVLLGTALSLRRQVA